MLTIYLHFLFFFLTKKINKLKGEKAGFTLQLEWLLRLKPPFLRDTENGRNSRNRGVENGKWQVSFSEMIQLIFAQNLSQFGRAFNKMLGKVYLLPTFPSKCCFICLWGHTFAVWMPFSALQCEEMFAERPFCLFTPGEVFLERCKQFPRFSNFNFLIQKNGKFWSVCTVFDRKRKNTENGKSIKRNLNFVKRRNGGLNLDGNLDAAISWFTGTDGK